MIDSLRIGGAQKLMVTFAAEMRRRGAPLTVISLHREEGSPMAKELAELGARVVVFAAESLADARRLWRLAAFLRREHVGVLQSHLTFANILGPLAGRLAGVPVVGTLHSSGSDPRGDKLVWSALEAAALGFGAKRVVAVGRSVAARHRRRMRGRPIRVIPNAVAESAPLPPSERAALRAQMADDAARTILIAVGRLAAPKGYGDLLAAFDIARQKHPSALLAIVGDGALRRRLEDEVISRGLRGNVTLMGARDDVPQLLAASDLFVSASHWEGMPVAVLEAVAAGLPVVATNVGDTALVVGEDAGVIVPPRQPPLLAEAIAAVLDDPARRRAMGEAARERAQQHCSSSAWCDSLLNLYAEIARDAR